MITIDLHVHIAKYLRDLGYDAKLTSVIDPYLDCRCHRVRINLPQDREAMIVTADTVGDEHRWRLDSWYVSPSGKLSSLNLGETTFLPLNASSDDWIAKLGQSVAV